NPTDRLFLLRNWAANTRDRQNSAGVVRYALDLAIRTTEYVPTATHFRQFATPLTDSKELEAIPELIGMFDSQRALLKKRGPTEEFIWLQLLLAECEALIAFEQAANRFLETYFSISEIQEVVVQTSCLARLMCSLAKCDPDKKLEAHSLHSVV